MRSTFAIILMMMISQSFAGERSLMRKLGNEIGSGWVLTVKHAKMGYSAELVEEKPSFPKKFRRFLNRLERKQKRLWKEYINNDEYYKELSPQMRKAIINDPCAKEVPCKKYLSEIQEIQKISYKGEHIGYVLETTDYAQSAIYEDGAWTTIYVDSQFNVVYSEEGSS